ncbi:transcription-repair coupling factor [Anaplasma bovis]|uniref:transcription-repair coupling factor n=1 Tax=Anaplasma bovis TaxID=186733 RepID=UPI002FF03C10
MSFLEKDLRSLPEDVFAAEICRTNALRSFVFIVREDSHLSSFAKVVSFFCNTHDILVFPPWDQDTDGLLSPSVYTMARRVKTLSDLARARRPYAVLTTMNAIIPKVPPRDALQALHLTLKPGMTSDIEHVVKCLTYYGYTESAVVNSMGNFSVREKIIDIFPPTANVPIRVYFTGNVIESIKTFDSDTQLTVGKCLQDFTLYPISEFLGHENAAPNQLPTRPNSKSTAQLSLFEPNEDINTSTEALNETFFHYVQHAILVLSESVLRDMSTTVQSMQLIASKCALSISNCISFLDFQTYRKITCAFLKIVLGKQGCTLQNATTARWEKDFSIPSVEYAPSFTPPHDQKKACAFRSATDYLQNSPKRVVFACYSEDSLAYFTKKLNECGVSVSKIFRYTDIMHDHMVTILPVKHNVSTVDLTIITEHDLLGRDCYIEYTAHKVTSEEEHSLAVGDVVVHRDYGVGIFSALRTMTVCENDHDFMEIVYQNNDKLFIPVEDMHLITKYGAKYDVVLDKLHSTAWKEKSSKLQARINDIAQGLLDAEASRKLSTSSKFLPDQKYIDFCRECPYVETEDQLRAIADVEQDLASGKVMDRLVCGDVGFGKTEIALRAAFLVSSRSTGNQVAIIVPTTLLCDQHLASFRERFKNYSINIQPLSRSSSSSRKEVLRGIADGSVHIVIGTSALLTDSVSFLDLGLLIIDEEQHFGVQQKEKLKMLKHDLHVLSLSATPIPRTLHMSMSGIKNLSVLRTPPVGRTAVKISIVKHFDYATIKTAILNEVHRGGRVFFTCPLISDIPVVQQCLARLVPDVKVTVAHGRMSHSLDKIMSNFLEGKFSVLLTTSIIESGLDIPIANTIIVYNADMFGLAQLYQLKGRVGRGTATGYAYFMLSDKATEHSTGVKRIETLKSLSNIGSGFSLAIQDMDMRGFGNLVGEEQSGNIKEVGIELYHQMLQEAMEERSEIMLNPVLHKVKVNMHKLARIPESYIKELDLRMHVYKKISSLKTKEDIDCYSSELVDRFGALPEEVVNLLNIIHIKRLCSIIGISNVTCSKQKIILMPEKDFPMWERVIKHFVENPEIFGVHGEGVEIKMRVPMVQEVGKYIISVLEPIVAIVSTMQKCIDTVST